MQKKKFDLTSDIINLASEEKRIKQNSTTNKETQDHKKSVLMTLSVDEDFRREFKTWCAKHGLKMNEAFIKGFELLKKF